MKILNVILVIVLALVISSTALASDEYYGESIFFAGQELGVGARAMGMGGAFLPIADDYSAMYWNPAGLGQMFRMELNIGFSHNQLETKGTAFGQEFTANNSFSRLNSIGLVFPIPTVTGSMVFGFGYNKIRDFDNILNYNGFNGSWSPFPDIAAPSYDQYLPEDQIMQTTVYDSLQQDYALNEEGAGSEFTFSGAVEVQKNFYLGASISFIGGKDEQYVTFEEKDILGIHNLPFHDENGDFLDPTITELDYWTLDQSITSDFSATQIKIGALYKIGRTIRLGATVDLPRTTKIKESWSESHEDFYQEWIYGPFDASGEYEYKIREPYGFNAGASFQFLNLLVSGSLDYKDWTQAEFLNDPPIYGTTKARANAFIRKEFKAVTKMHLGAEMYIPLVRARIRAGYSQAPTPYANENVISNKDYLTAGVSFLLDRQVMVDLSAMQGTWQQETIDALSNQAVMEDRTFNKLVGTLAIRF